MHSTRTVLRLLRLCRPFAVRITIAVVALVVLAGCQLYLTWLFKLWTEHLLAGDPDLGTPLAFAKALAVVLVMVSAIFVSRYLLITVDQRLVCALRDKAVERLLRCDLRIAQEYQAGDLLARVFQDGGRLAELISDLLTRLVGQGVVMLGALGMLFYLNARLALSALIVTPVVALLFDRLGALVRRWSRLSQEAGGALSSSLDEQIHGLTTIKTYQTEDREVGRFVELDATYLERVLRSEWWTSTLVSAVWLIGGLGVLGAVFWGSREVLEERMSAGDLVAFCLYAAQVLEPLRRLSDFHARLQRQLASATRLFEIIDLQSAVEAGSGGESPSMSPVRNGGASLRVDRVVFGYRTEASVLSGLSLRLDPGEQVAAVAASGGGKSTLIKLLFRFEDPETGSISLDGVDLRELDLSDLRRRICLVPPETFIFRGSFLENVRYGSSDAEGPRVDEAVAMVGLEPLLQSLPGGLAAELAEGGRSLSGGQKQRIGLARAVLREPSLLLLDEATSALDSDAEDEIFDALAPWLARRTVLAMSHRLATVSRFPRLLVLEGGRIVSDGPPAVLLTECPSFRLLFSEQVAPLETLNGSRLAAG